MHLIKTVVFCLFFLPFFGCQKQQEKPEIHQIRFGSLDGNPKDNNTNKGWRFFRFMQIDLNTDSVLLKQNQNSIDEHEIGKKPAKYYTGKISPEVRSEIADFRKYVSQKESGPKFENAHEFSGGIYCGPLLFLEYRKDTLIRYFYVKFDSSDQLYDSLLSSFSKNLYNFAVSQKALKLAKLNFQLDDDSLVGPIVNRNDFLENAPPPPVQKTIKFTPPVK